MFTPIVTILKPTEPTDNGELPLETASLFNIAQQPGLLVCLFTSLLNFFSLDFILPEFQFTGKTMQLPTSRLKGVQTYGFLTVLQQTQVFLRLCLNPVIISYHPVVDSQNWTFYSSSFFSACPCYVYRSNCALFRDRWMFSRNVKTVAFRIVCHTGF